MKPASDAAWRCRRTAAASVALLLACQACGARAQAQDSSLGTRSLAQHLFRRPFSDTMTVSLVKHGFYRIAVWPGQATVRIRARVRGAEPGFAPRVREGNGSDPSVIEFDPLDNAPHEITVDAPGGIDEVRLAVWEDANVEVAAARRRARRIHLGLMVAMGQTSGYEIGEALPASASRYMEGGVLIGNSSRFSLLFGFGNDPRSRGVESVNWVFAEPRFRLFRLTPGGHDLGIHLVARYAQGNSTNIIEDPSYVGAGALVTWHLDHRHDISGVIVGAELSYGRVRNVDAANQHATRLAWSLSWSP